MNFYIGIDVGTSATKMLLVDSEGIIHNTVVKEYPIEYPCPGWSQQDPEDWRDAVLQGVPELLEGFEGSNVVGIGCGGQMHGLVILDEGDRVIRPALLWNDGRTAKETAYLNTQIGQERLSEMTGNIAFAGFTATKLLWLKENEPINFERIKKIMLPKDYINYILTGVHSSDYSDASGTLLLDVENKCWSNEMLNICGVSETQMPRLFESYECIGTVRPEMAEVLGIPASVKVCAGAGDNAAAAIGTGTVGEGSCNISLGTSGTVFISSERFRADDNSALHAFAHADGGYHLMGCILSAASCNKWFCEDILQNDNYDAEQAAITDDMLGSNHVFFLPYLMGERSPINDTNARGTFTGLRMDTKREDMLQAVLEGVAFAIRDNLDVAKSQGIHITCSSLCGGGAKSPLWQKILSNVLDIAVTIPQTEQGPGYGAAMLAMIGTGEYSSVKECVDKLVQTRETLLPDTEIAARYSRQYEKFKGIYPAMKKVFLKM